MGKATGQQTTPDVDALTLEVVTTADGFQALREEWGRLLATMPRPSAFLSWEWQFTWWQQFGHAAGLRLVVVRGPGGRLRGIAPLHLVRRRTPLGVAARSLELLGYRGSAVGADHLDFLAGGDDRERIVAALLAAVGGDGGWDVLVLADLAEDSPLRRLAAALGASHAEETGETCYYLPLPPEPAALWAGIKAAHPKLASNVKYYRKRMADRHQVTFVPEVTTAEVEATLGALTRLHGMSRGRKGEAGNFGRPGYQAFHAALMPRMAAAGELYLARLEVDGAIAAVLYGYRLGGVLFYYQSGFDMKYSALSIGTLMVAWVLEDAITRLGVREFDFLRGAEEYKTRWTAELRRTTNLWMWRRSWGGRLDHWQWRTRRQLRPWKRRVQGLVGRRQGGSQSA
jgi:CelD/BcsL family acetyltransferase involved in cellulose biosynthesis